MKFTPRKAVRHKDLLDVKELENRNIIKEREQMKSNDMFSSAESKIFCSSEMLIYPLLLLHHLARVSS